MTEQDTALPRWRDPRWRAGATDWVDAALLACGRRRDGGPTELHARPWSTVWRVPAPDGPVWFKASAHGTAYEAGLVAALARWLPEHVLHPLAVDAERGWLLLPDGGTTLRAAQGGRTDLPHWEQVLTEYAGLQRALEPRVDEMLALGVPDNRPEVLPTVREDLLGDDAALQTGRPGGMTSAQRDRHRAASSAYARLCADLAALGIPATLNHDDLHDANVFLTGSARTPYRVFDWGDATVAHPFATLLVTLRVVADRCGLAPGAPELLRLRDAYLEQWTGEYAVTDLREAVRLALRVGGVGRSACYRRALLEATPAGHEAFGDGVPAWLTELFEPTPVEADPLLL